MEDKSQEFYELDKPQEFYEMLGILDDLLDDYHKYIKGNKNDENWEVFRHNWNLFIESFPHYLIKQIIPKHYIKEL